MERDASFKIKIVIIAVLFLIIVNRFVIGEVTLFNPMGVEVFEAEVVEVLDSTDSAITDSGFISGTEHHFKALITGGAFEGQTVDAYQGLLDHASDEKIIEVGDQVVLQHFEDETLEENWIFMTYKRLHYVIYLAVFFVLAILAFGLLKGLNALIGLVLTIAMVFLVFIPAIMKGQNIYLWTIITVIFSAVVTIGLITGQSKKSFVTILGTTFGAMVAVVLTLVLNRVMGISGNYSEETYYLFMLDIPGGLDLVALVFASIVIGSLGAVMDVAMDMSSSLYEIAEQVKGITLKALFMSGIRIGRDVMGTMANTLILAYIGSSLVAVILMITYSYSLFELLNRERIVIEMVNSLIGSLAILFTMPLTAFIGALIYRGGVKEED